MTKTDRTYYLILQVFFLVLICGFMSSCKKKQSVNGTWVYTFNVLEFSNDTVSFSPTGERFLFSINQRQIILTKKLREVKGGLSDSLNLPFVVGKLSENGSSFSSDFFGYKEKAKFEKLKKSNSSNSLEKIQFTTHNGWDWGCNYEIDMNGICVYETEGYDFVSNTYTFKLEEPEFEVFLNLKSLVNLDSLKSEYVNGGCSDFPGYSFSFISDIDTVNTFIYCSLEHKSLIPLRYFLEGITYRNSKDSVQHQKLNKKVFNSKIVECQSDSICMINYFRRFDTLQYHLPKHDKTLLRKLFNKYYFFDNDNICYRIRSNAEGEIDTFEFYDKRNEIKSDFLEELKSTMKVQPAVFKGMKIAIEDFECISYIND